MITITITIILAIIEIYHYVRTGFGLVEVLRFIGVIGIIISVWTLRNHNIKQCKDNQELRYENEQLLGELQETKNNNRDYDKLFNSLAGAIYSFDISNDYVYYSKGIEDLYGYSQKELTEDTDLWKRIIHPEDISKVERNELELRRGVSTRIEYRIHHPHLGERWLIKFSTPLIDKNGKVSKINGQLLDVTFRKDLEKELKQMAFYDELTDIPNRKLLNRHIEKALARSKRHHHNFSIMFIDLDDFKIVNDTMGHDVGDKLLKEVVTRINESIREGDLVARIGGDEFIIVLEETNRDEIEMIAKRLIEYVAHPYSIDEKEANISLSIGVSMYPHDGEDKETLIDHADKAMYYAKNQGKNNYKLYTTDLAASNKMEINKVGLLEKLKTSFQNTKIFK